MQRGGGGTNHTSGSGSFASPTPGASSDSRRPPVSLDDVVLPTPPIGGGGPTSPAPGLDEIVLPTPPIGRPPEIGGDGFPDLAPPLGRPPDEEFGGGGSNVSPIAYDDGEQGIRDEFRSLVDKLVRQGELHARCGCQ